MGPEGEEGEKKGGGDGGGRSLLDYKEEGDTLRATLNREREGDGKRVYQCLG